MKKEEDQNETIDELTQQLKEKEMKICELKEVLKN